MSRNNVLAGVLVLVVVLMITISTLLVVNYVTAVLNAAVKWATQENLDALVACGLDAPIEIYKLRTDITALLLPAIYVGLPGLMIIIAVLMFIAGHYYGSGEQESSSETTTTISSPNRSKKGRYQPGRRVKKTRTQKSSSSSEN